MKIFKNSSDTLSIMKSDQQMANEKLKLKKSVKSGVLTLFGFIILIGISYIILSPLIELVTHAFFSDNDATDPMVYVVAKEPTIEKFQRVIATMKYWGILLKTLGNDLILMGIQVLVCSMVGYGFARFDFPFKKIWFACVVVMIVIPVHVIMLPLYVTFRSFDIFGIISMIKGNPLNFHQTLAPIYIMTAFGCGLNAGIYIYIFNQFFRGLPKEIEEAAFVDGAGSFYTYFRIMLVNAMPSVITVSVFAMVWQYNDYFFVKLFNISSWLSMKVASISASVASVFQLNSPTIINLYLDAAIVLDILPVLLVYIFLQRYFVEGVERSGIVG